MSDWNRVDYDKLEADGRWSGPVMSGIPHWLAFYLLLSAILLLPWSPIL